MLRDLEHIRNKSIACSLLGAHTGCDYLRNGIVRHSHDRTRTSKITGNRIMYSIPPYECPTCSCQCECHK